MAVVGLCGLCETEKPLRHSHVIPAFMIRWRKRRGTKAFQMLGWALSGLGRAFTKRSRRPQQDGPKAYLLCADCELRIGLDEGKFANLLFEILSSRPELSRVYGAWLYRFVASLILRAVLYARIHGQELPEWSEAVSAWRCLLLGKQVDCAAFELHLLPIPQGPIQGKVPENLPADWDRLVQNHLLITFANVEDVSGTKIVPVAIVKIGNLIFIGYGVASPIPNDWIDYQVWQRGGVIGGCQVRIPDAIYNILRQWAEQNRHLRTAKS